MNRSRNLIGPIIALAHFAGWGGSSEADDTGPGSQAGSGLFSGSLGDKHYEVAVNCRFFDTDS